MRRKLIVLLALFVLLAFLAKNFAQENRNDKNMTEKEAEQALQDFREIMENDTETKYIEEFEKTYEEVAKARNRLLKLGKLATPVLIRAIKTKRFNEYFRGTCIDLLYKIGDKRAIEALEERLKKEKDKLVLRHLNEALRKLKE